MGWEPFLVVIFSETLQGRRLVAQKRTEIWPRQRADYVTDRFLVFAKTSWWCQTSVWLFSRTAEVEKHRNQCPCSGGRRTSQWSLIYRRAVQECQRQTSPAKAAVEWESCVYFTTPGGRGAQWSVVPQLCQCCAAQNKKGTSLGPSLTSRQIPWCVHKAIWVNDTFIIPFFLSPELVCNHIIEPKSVFFLIIFKLMIYADSLWSHYEPVGEDHKTHFREEHTVSTSMFKGNSACQTI